MLGACASPPASTETGTPAAIPAYLQAATGCAIVAGGNIGSRFADPQVTANWSRINGAITTELHDRLVAQQLKAVKLLVPAGHERKAEDVVFEGLVANRCNRVLQIAHKVAEDASGRYFQFDVSMFRAVPKPASGASGGALSVVATSDFQRSYRFTRTQESFDNFYTGTFAETVLADLVASGVLEPLR